MKRIVETDEQVRAHTHKFPEQVHLEDVGCHDKAEHRHGEEREVSVVALESLLSMHVAERIDVNHKADR